MRFGKFISLKWHVKHTNGLFLSVFLFAIFLIHPWRFSELSFMIQSLSPDDLILNLMPNAQRAPESDYQDYCDINIHQLKTHIVCLLLI